MMAMGYLDEWKSPPPRVRLGADEAHVWLAALDVGSELTSLAQNLSSDERQKAARFFQQKHKEWYAAARGLLRELLGQYSGLAPQKIEFAVNPFGKPSLAGGAAESDLRFNVSHSHGLALMAFTRKREIGIDLEKVRAEVMTEQIAQRFFAPAESARLRSLPVAELPAAFFQCWTRKEAYIKARGDGLSRRLDSFEVAFGPGVAPSILKAEDDADAATRWTVVDLKAAGDYFGALVIEGQPASLKRWRWNQPTEAQ